MALPTNKPLAKASGAARPRLLGRYHVLDEIGHNAVGPLNLARLEGPKGFQRWAAIRRVDPVHLAEPGYAQRFFERVRAGAQLFHPNVAALFDVGEEDRVPWLAIEYLHGERLEETIASLEFAGTSASWEIATRIIADAAEGLFAVHSLRDANGVPLGLLHGDLAPHSVVVTFEGKTKIKGAFEPRAHGVLDPRKVPYAAPEQLFEGSLDGSADVFALGVMLWELLTGKRLFARATDDETRAMIETNAIPPLATMVDEAPRELDALVRRALMRDPAARFPSARELSRELESLLVWKGVVARDDDVARFMRTLFGEDYAEREAALAAAADVTEVFRKSQQVLAARRAAAKFNVPDFAYTRDEEDDDVDADGAQTHLMVRGAPHTEDDLAKTAERPAVPLDGPTNPRNLRPPVPPDTEDELPTMSAPQGPVFLLRPEQRLANQDEPTVTVTTTRDATASAAASASGPRLVMPALMPEPVTQSAIFVPPRIPAMTPPDFDSSPPPVPPPRHLMPSYPDRPLLPATPPSGLEAYGHAPMQLEGPPPSPPAPLPTYPMFAQQPAWPAQPSARRPQPGHSTETVRALLFPQDRTRRIAVVSVAGFVGGAILFVLFFLAWRPVSPQSTATDTQPAPTVTAPPSATEQPSAAAPIHTPISPPAAVQSASSRPAEPAASVPSADSSQAAQRRIPRRRFVPQTPVHETPHETPHETAAANSGKTGYLTVMCKPDACDHVIDGGHDLGGSPLFHHEVSAGKHVLTLRIDSSHAQRVVTVDVPEGQTVAIHPEFAQ